MAETERRHHHGTCLSCGGQVDAEGYALGGEIAEEELPTDGEPTDSEQIETTEEMRDAAFASSLRGGRR